VRLSQSTPRDDIPESGITYGEGYGDGESGPEIQFYANPSEEVSEWADDRGAPPTCGAGCRLSGALSVAAPPTIQPLTHPLPPSPHRSYPISEESPAFAEGERER